MFVIFFLLTLIIYYNVSKFCGETHSMNKKIQKINILLAILLLLSGCVTESNVLNGSDGSPIPSAFANFPDIPFPEKSFLELGDTKALGTGENWIGSLAFTSPYNASRIFDFYVSEMPKSRWIEIAVVRARISQMTYYRDNRAVQILIESINEKDSRITITAVPNQAKISQGE